MNNSPIVIKEKVVRGRKIYQVYQDKIEIFSGNSKDLKEFKINYLFDSIHTLKQTIENHLDGLETRIAALENSVALVEPLD